MSLKRIWQTAAGVTGLLAISGLAAANGSPEMAIAAAGAASVTSAYLGMQVLQRMEPK